MKSYIIDMMLRFSSEACVLLDRSLSVVAANDLARKQFAMRTGVSLYELFQLDADQTGMFQRCFAGTAPLRFQVSTQIGPTINATGWRLGRFLQEQQLIAVKLENSLRIKAEFVNMTRTHRINVQRAKQLHLRNARLVAENQQLSLRAETDPMTGLLNAQGLRVRMQQAIDNNRPFALFYIDMNELKAINDTRGHAAGDAAIMALAQAIKTNVRSTDFASRIGGDEFGLIVFEFGETQNLFDIGRSIVSDLSKLPVAHGRLPAKSLTAAIGVATWPLDGTTRQQIEDCAEEAMYVSKCLRQGTVIYDPTLKQSRALQSLN